MHTNWWFVYPVFSRKQCCRSITPSAVQFMSPEPYRWETVSSQVGLGPKCDQTLSYKRPPSQKQGPKTLRPTVKPWSWDFVDDFA